MACSFSTSINKRVTTESQVNSRKNEGTGITVVFLLTGSKKVMMQDKREIAENRKRVREKGGLFVYIIPRFRAGFKAKYTEKNK